MKKLPILIIAGAVMLLMNSCMWLLTVNEVSGTIYGNPTNLVIGAFPDSYNFIASTGYNATDEVASESSSQISFHPIRTAFISGNYYTITMPDDPSEMGDLIAWDDVDGDGMLDYNDGFGEVPYFTVKYVDLQERVVRISQFGTGYAFLYDDGLTDTIEALTDYNNTGFNFYID